MAKSPETDNFFLPGFDYDTWHERHGERVRILRRLIGTAALESACNADTGKQPVVAEEENKKTNQTKRKNYKQSDSASDNFTMTGMQVDLTQTGGGRITCEFGNAVIDGKVTNDLFFLEDGCLRVSPSGKSGSNEPAIGIIERENELIVLAELPKGVSGKISAEATGSELKLTSADGLFNKMVALPHESSPEDEPLVLIEDGILKIVVRKK